MVTPHNYTQMEKCGDIRSTVGQSNVQTASDSQAAHYTHLIGTKPKPAHLAAESQGLGGTEFVLVAASKEYEQD